MALFFALTGHSTGAHLWVMNGYLLNSENGFDEPYFPLVGVDPLPEYADCFLGRAPTCRWTFEKPIFVQVPWVSDRIGAQQGFFTIHTDNRPLNTVSSKWVRRIDIPPDAIAGAERFLQMAGISESVVFPDLQGYSQFLRKRYNL